LSPFGANLARRVGTAVVALPALLAACFLGPPALPVALVAGGRAAGLWEFFRLLEARRLRPQRRTGCVLTPRHLRRRGMPGLGRRSGLAPRGPSCSSR
jgi:hypothetical protein